MTDPITTPEVLDACPWCTHALGAHRAFGCTTDVTALGSLPSVCGCTFRPDAPTPPPAKCPTCWSSTPSIRLPIGSIRRIKRCEDPWHDEAPTRPPTPTVTTEHIAAEAQRRHPYPNGRMGTAVLAVKGIRAAEQRDAFEAGARWALGIEVAP